MKVVFVGPSLPDASDHIPDDIISRAPAMQGDIMQAVSEGAKLIGLIDGQFEFVAPVWHKEILFALSKGVTVLGSASMGALRAAECATFGMTGIGKIYEEYASGLRWDDADVALLYGPPELNYPPISLPMVNVDATLKKATDLALISKDQQTAISLAAREVFFKDRTWKKIAEVAKLERSIMDEIVKYAYVDQKRADALTLLKAMQTERKYPQNEAGWTFNATPIWRAMYS
ncbi:TfuA-like protein [Cohaesibacter gelatinilyticus]|uniref:TfuA-like core domain-containing protein n=1 Tax=Cohaesibacter gelatinilyticus TaxID=372072 RepID=A0A285PBK4_9HYPH|nr:TfuA-like protein [Cohaesibacter gelatinilyticus]SNZ19112.1 hypothetical protein SAMN06265368_2192 [Cohaesibacter gelatinilyticus]